MIKLYHLLSRSTFSHFYMHTSTPPAHHSAYGKMEVMSILANVADYIGLLVILGKFEVTELT